MINLEFICDAESTAGYAAHARLMLRAFHEVGLEGINLRVLSRQKEPVKARLQEVDIAALRSFASTEFRKPDVRVFFEPAYWTYTEADVKTICFCQWETTKIRGYDWKGKPEHNWVRQLGKMDGIFTSSMDAMKVFAGSGLEGYPLFGWIPGPIFPHTVYGELPIPGLTVTEKGEIIPKEERPVVVGYMAHWDPRKNPDTFLRDTMVAFDRKEVAILLKTHGSMKFDDGARIRNAVKGVREVVGKDNAPEIFVITEPLTDMEVSQFFNTVDIYYAPSRGEGFSIPVSMACAADKFPIVPTWGGPADYVPTHYQVGGTFSPAVGMGAFDWDQHWFEIDERSAINALKSAYKNVKAGKKPHGYEEQGYVSLSRHVNDRAGPEVFVRAFRDAVLTVYKGESRQERLGSVHQISETNG